MRRFDRDGSEERAGKLPGHKGMGAEDAIAAIVFEFKNDNQVILEVIRPALMPCLGYGINDFHFDEERMRLSNSQVLSDCGVFD